MYIKVAKDCFVPEENIKLYVAYSGNAVKELVKRLKEDNKVLDLSGKKKALSIILLKTGEAVITPLSIDTITSRAENWS